MRRRQETRSASRSHARVFSGATAALLLVALAVALAPFGCAPAAFVMAGDDASADDGSSGPIVVVSDGGAAEASPPGNSMPGDASSRDGNQGPGGCVVMATGVVGVLGCPCPMAGATACTGNAQAEELICQGGVWSTNGTCPQGQLCDTRMGLKQGSCADVVDACAALSPGQTSCVDLSSEMQCGVDLLTTFVINCTAQQTCVDGGCGGVCAFAPPGPLANDSGASQPSTQCAGSTLQQCNASGAWVDLMTCPVTCCGDRCTDSTTDGANCGVCGHRCLSGPCMGGVCQPAQVGGPADSSALQGPIAVDSQNVYVTTSSGVMIGSITALGGTLESLVNDRSGASGIATDGVDVYWTEPPNGLVMGVPVAGGAPFTVASGQRTPSLIALGASSIYWTATTASSGGAILSVPLAGVTGVADGGPSPAPATVYSGPYPVVDLAVDSQSVYFAQSGCYTQGSAQVCSRAISSLPLAASADGGAAAPTFLAAPAGDAVAAGLAVGSSAVYWTTPSKCVPTDAGPCSDLVQSAGLDGGAPQTIASLPGLLGPIAADDTSLYVAASSLLVMPLDGGMISTFAAGTAASGLAQDSASLYWTDLTQGQVLRLAKH
jgi:hypothetical protein